LTIKRCTGIYVCPVALTTIISLIAVRLSAQSCHYDGDMAASCGKDALQYPVIVPFVVKLTASNPELTLTINLGNRKCNHWQ